MSERRDNSVLFSLKELRNIEEDRVRQEYEEEQSRIEAQRLAEEEARRLQREEEERRIREEQERIERAEAERQRQIREEQLRLEEAERKARIEAQAKLEATRIQAEIQAKAGKRPPIGIILGSIGGVIALAAGALLYVFLVVIPAREAEQEKRSREAQERAIAAAIDKVKTDLQSEYDEKIKNAKDEAERARLLAEKKAREDAQTDAIRKNASRPKSSSSSSSKSKPVKQNCDPDKDPLCGSGL